MSTLRKKWFVMAAVITMWAAIHPGMLSAQNSGVGGDGNTRFFWKGTDSSISLWELNPGLAYLTNHAYGPYYAWVPSALTVGSDSYTRVLWKNTNGSISLWLLDPNLNYVTSKVYGPYSGWTAEGLSTDPTNNYTRVIWKDTSGSISVWIVDNNNNYLSSSAYGPYFGWEAGASKAARLKSGARAATAGVVDQQAAAAMNPKAP